MRNVFTVVLTIFLCCLLLCACSFPTGTAGTTLNHGQPPQVVIEEPPYGQTYSFDSYEDIILALTSPSTNGFATLKEDQANYGDVYINTLAAFASKEIKVAVPQLNGQNIDLREEAGYAKVSFLSSELYNLPWLWYHCVVNGYDLDVKISYLTVLENAKVNAAASYYEVLSMIAPDAPSPKNFQQYDAYKNIYEREIVLAGNQAVTAMVAELKDSTKVYVRLYLDGMLISLRADQQLFSDAFWHSFAIKQYE